MFKRLSVILLLPFMLLAEDNYFYRNGEKVSLEKVPGSYTLIRDVSRRIDFAKVKSVFSSPKVKLLKNIKSEDLSSSLKNLKLLPAYRINGSKSVFYSSGNIFVKIRKGAEGKAFEKWAEDRKLKLVHKFSYINWYLLETEGDAVAVARELKEKGDVLSAEPSFYYPVSKRSVKPDDPYFSKQWYLFNDGTDDELSGDDHTHVPGAWDVLENAKYSLGKDVKIAIIDDGFDLSHEDFKGRFYAAKDFSGGLTDQIFNKYYDRHGMACAGIAAATMGNGIGVAGACPECTVIPIRMNMRAYSLDSSAIQAFEYAMEKGAHVVSNSWGPQDGGGPADMNAPLKELVKKMATEGRGGRGIVIIFASGNGNESMELDGYAKNPNVISIGAVDASGKRASYSDYGPSLDFVASSAGRENGKLFDGIWTTDLSGAAGYNEGEASGYVSERDGDSDGNYTGTFGGTSASAPLAAGIVSLMLSANPYLTKDDVYSILKGSCDKVGPESYDSKGFNIYYGYGRINAERAVSKALELRDEMEKDADKDSDTDSDNDTDPDTDTDTGSDTDSDNGGTGTSEEVKEGAPSIDADVEYNGDADPVDPVEEDTRFKKSDGGCSLTVLF